MTHLKVAPAELRLLRRPGLRLGESVGVAEGVEPRVERVEAVQERLEERVCKEGREREMLLDHFHDI